jgi:hypothetical protein
MLFGLFKKNDWILVWNSYSEWTVQSVHPYGGNYETKERCFYKIYYSKLRNKYKMECEGYDPYKHFDYNKALTKLSELNNELLNK